MFIDEGFVLEDLQGVNGHLSSIDHLKILTLDLSL